MDIFHQSTSTVQQEDARNLYIEDVEEMTTDLILRQIALTRVLQGVSNILQSLTHCM